MGFSTDRPWLGLSSDLNQGLAFCYCYGNGLHKYAGAVDIDIGYEANDSGTILYYADFCHTFSSNCEITFSSCNLK